MSKSQKTFLAYTIAVLISAIGYYAYVYSFHLQSSEKETLLSEFGEWIGEVALWVFVFIYIRTAIKLIMGRGPLSKRLLPDYSAPESMNYLQYILVYLDRSHVYFGMAAVALVLVHIALMGLHSNILFFPVVLALVLWQGLFGMFLSWRKAPRDLRKWSYYVHAQLITGVAIGIFAYFGHLLVDS